MVSVKAAPFHFFFVIKSLNMLDIRRLASLVPLRASLKKTKTLPTGRQVTAPYCRLYFVNVPKRQCVSPGQPMALFDQQLGKCSGAGGIGARFLKKITAQLQSACFCVL